MKDEILLLNTYNNPKVYSHEQAVKSMQEYSDQQNAKLREAFLEAIKIVASYETHTPHDWEECKNFWLIKAGL